MIDGVLYRRRQEENRNLYQLVLPVELRPIVLQSLHDEMGHMGVERTLDLVRSRFYWPKMAIDVEKKIHTCGRCVRRKALPDKAAPLVNILTTRPLELVCIDFLSIEPDSKNTKDVLVITDHFTKYAIAVPTPNQKARTVAKCLWDTFVVHYGLPERLHSDQGPDFESTLIKELCALVGVRKCRTSPYHPRGNPVERFNRTLLNMLGTLKDKEKSHWSDFVKSLVHAYNCTKNEVTGFTPYELMFGRRPRLPVDIAFGLPLEKNQNQSHSQYMTVLKAHLEESYRLATQAAAKIAHKNKVKFDKRVTESTLNVGDRVLVRNVRIRGKHKLSDKWEPMVYIVVKCAGELPVYTVKPENDEGPLRTLHRDLLLPCGFLTAESARDAESATASEKLRRPRTRQTPCDKIHDDTSDLGDEEDDQIPVFYPHHLEPSEPIRFTVEYNANSKGDTQKKSSSPKLQSDLESQYLPVEIPVKAVESYLPLKDPVERRAKYLPESVPEKNSAKERVVYPPGNLPELKDAEHSPVPEGPTKSSDPREEEMSVIPETVESDCETAEVRENSLFSAKDRCSPVMLKNSDQGRPDMTEPQAGTETHVRRSSRDRVPARRFHYPELGNPLVTVVTSLFQGLNSAIANSLNGLAGDDIDSDTVMQLAMPVTAQPTRYATGRAYI
ncbi:uncharacterized protein LOC125802000 [Astyanax mexicanus]|uniref:uncharacterized protein LOC125802000 n=1 Tax=Astyanax mexicanus TaxID=7994 RepID=UPI0020CB03CB|nr:uncharacterized protein LOC125802000 [Astyanax mexicanus]XP_049335000.1 uncharacterized protein LOC125802000 [Astyanax mexicanus]XP_049335001.1 uncharacterized protein LOC125802000 [Astyanax mexicanus]XP_049335002.1 uncharacterized protein LOC125802000 [Astyanax mexicanus]XP_049335003.1 uncharacterized protein LOC125802000 [Astyanax mexicanus]